MDVRLLRLRSLGTASAVLFTAGAAMYAGLFLLPLAVSFYLYYGLRGHPAGTTIHGELIEPARPLIELP